MTGAAPLSRLAYVGVGRGRPAVEAMAEGCRAGTTGALVCLAHHPERRRSDATRAALDLLLQRETRDEATLGFEITRLLGVEPARGFATFYGSFDLVLLLDLVGRVGISREDIRVVPFRPYAKRHHRF